MTSVYIKGTTYSNLELLEQLRGLTISGEVMPQAVDLLAQLVTKPPTVQFYANLQDCQWAQYIKKSNKTYSTMHTALKFIQKNQVVQSAFLAYEQDANVRQWINFFHEQDDKNRVPYLHVMLKSLWNLTGKKQAIRTVEGVTALLADTAVHKIILDAVELNRLKEIGGATNTVPGHYDWILTAEDKMVRPDLATIAEADYRADLGGGYATADISRLLGAQFISHDLTDPKTFSPELLYRENDPVYVAAVQATPFQYFDVFESKFPQGKGKYVITSFGFLISTVTSTSDSEANGKNVVSTLLAGLERVLELVASGAEVYCYWYSRASRRLYQNAAIQLWWKDGRLVKSKIASRPFSNFAEFMATAASVEDKYLFSGEENAG